MLTKSIQRLIDTLHVLEYLGRYTHRVAISNNRLREFSDGAVTFAWKVYRDRYQRRTGVSLRDCAHCGNGQMARIETFLPWALTRGPPPTAP